MSRWRAEAACAVSEPVFVPRERSTAEGDGYLLITLYDARADASSLLVFDALAVASGPITRAHLPHRVPAGFHGSFVSIG
jgi:carotenoid cleavage dioxygenase